ncbi:MAG: hypothetical protein RL334_437 [Chloroflexota bacterium]
MDSAGGRAQVFAAAGCDRGIICQHNQLHGIRIEDVVFAVVARLTSVGVDCHGA